MHLICFFRIVNFKRYARARELSSKNHFVVIPFLSRLNGKKSGDSTNVHSEERAKKRVHGPGQMCCKSAEKDGVCA